MTSTATSQTPAYTLLYHPGVPGRGEFIRLCFAAAHTPYTEAPAADVYSLLGHTTNDAAGNPPIFAPPALRIAGAGPSGSPLLISQTSNILLFLGPRLGLTPDTEWGRAWTHQLALTALDVNDAAHDTHHPVATNLYYEDQKAESLIAAREFRTARMPKFFAHFEGVLAANEEGGGLGRYFVGEKLTYADVAVWQVLDGLFFAFPNEMAHLKREGAYPRLFETFYPGFKEEDGIREYLASGKRSPYSNGVYRYYPELDRAEG